MWRATFRIQKQNFPFGRGRNCGRYAARVPRRIAERRAVAEICGWTCSAADPTTHRSIILRELPRWESDSAEKMAAEVITTFTTTYTGTHISATRILHTGKPVPRPAKLQCCRWVMQMCC